MHAKDTTMQLKLDSAILENLFTHAASAARRVGSIDDRVDGTLGVGPLADHIDAIVHELSELLGKPHPIAACVPGACGAFASTVVTRGDVVPQNHVPERVATDDLDTSMTMTAE